MHQSDWRAYNVNVLHATTGLELYLVSIEHFPEVFDAPLPSWLFQDKLLYAVYTI